MKSNSEIVHADKNAWISTRKTLPIKAARWFINKVPFRGRLRVANLISLLFVPRSRVVLQHINGGYMVFDFKNMHEISMYFDVFAPALSGTIKSVLRPGDIFIDCGANIGYFTFLAASLVSPSGCVLSIDANPFCIERIKESKLCGKYSNITIIEGAVGESSGEMCFNIADDPMYSSFSDLNQLDFAKTSKTIKVPIYTLDDLWGRFLAGSGEKIRFLKLDVEGAEIDALKGMPNILKEKRIEYIYIETHKQQIELRAQKYTDVFTILEQNGYKVCKQFNQSTYLYKLLE